MDLDFANSLSSAPMSAHLSPFGGCPEDMFAEASHGDVRSKELANGIENIREELVEPEGGRGQERRAGPSSAHWQPSRQALDRIRKQGAFHRTKPHFELLG
jgi:hypothetical protein